MAKILQGLTLIHSNDCMHRDIKLENILASAPSSPLRAVIIHFGAATLMLKSDDPLKGTIRYLVPEIIALKQGTVARSNSYDAKADVWALGWTAYGLLCG